MNGKGDAPRNCFSEQYRENYDSIFRKEERSRLLDDGFGNVWMKCEREDCDLHIVRPGKVQCQCETECT
jgi:hypothetical protein